MIQFDCEGCGTRVYAWGRTRPPAHGFCASCAFVCEFVTDPEEFWAMHQRLVPAEKSHVVEVS